jgi:hypothetical protein
VPFLSTSWHIRFRHHGLLRSSSIFIISDRVVRLLTSLDSRVCISTGLRGVVLVRFQHAHLLWAPPSLLSDFVIISVVRLSPLGTTATVGLLYQPQMIDDGDCGMKIGRGNRSTRRKPAPAPLYPPQIPHEQTRARSRVAAVGSQPPVRWLPWTFPPGGGGVEAPETRS